jgi:hypothetical protein
VTHARLVTWVLQTSRFVARVGGFNVRPELLRYILPFEVPRFVAAVFLTCLRRRAQARAGNRADIRWTVRSGAALLASLQRLHLAAAFAVLLCPGQYRVVGKTSFAQEMVENGILRIDLLKVNNRP